MITLSLKSVVGNDYTTALDNLCYSVAVEAARFEFLRESDRLSLEDKQAFCAALLSGDAPDVQRQLEAFFQKAVSVRDTAVRTGFKESFYHGIMLGILGYKSSWETYSNQESGKGYYDIAVEIPSEKVGILIELKYAEKGAFEAKCKAALGQIKENGYTKGLVEAGMKSVWMYGIACRGKECRVMAEQELL